MQLLYAPIWLFFVVMCLYVSFDSVARSIAFGFYHSGNYIAAESVYRVAQRSYYHSNGGESLSVCYSNKAAYLGSDLLVDSAEKLKAIKIVYGPNSKQLESFYRSLAIFYRFCATRQNTPELFDKSKNFARLSALICVAEKDFDGAASSIGIAAFCSASQNKTAEARCSILEALDYWRKTNSSKPVVVDFGVYELKLAAEMIGDQSLVEMLRAQRTVSSDHLLQKPSGFFDATLITILLPFGLMVWLLRTVERPLFSIVYSQLWQRRLSVCSNSIEQIELLDKLTTIKAYLGDIDQADAYSKLMLRRCEELQCA